MSMTMGLPPKEPLHSGPIQAQLNDGTLNGYQQAASVTAIYPGRGTFQGLIYTTLKLNGEAGEAAEKVGKCMRDHGGVLNDERRNALALELGDTLWYIANSAKELGYTLEQIAQMNINKLASRQRRDKLNGSGDNR